MDNYFRKRVKNATKGFAKGKEVLYTNPTAGPKIPKYF
jgi:hypothetical protein